MSWEYSGDPATSSKDEVRFLIGDTDETDQQLQDEEVDYLVTTHGDVGAAAVAACAALATRYGRRSVDVKVVGDLRIEYANRSAEFRELAKHIEATVSTVRPVPVMMGRTFDQQQEARDETDRVPTAFEVGMDDDERVHADDREWNQA